MQTSPSGPSDASSGVPDASSDPSPAAHGRLALVLWVAAAVVLVDLLTKLAVVAWLEGEDDVELIGGFLTLTVLRNSGAAFGLGAGFTVLFTLVAVVVAAVVVRQARRLRSTAWALVLGALLGGALGNLVDRVLRDPSVLQGHVVDWIRLPSWPVFNVADAAISCAAVGVVVLSLMNVPLAGRHADAVPDDDRADDRADDRDDDA